MNSKREPVIAIAHDYLTQRGGAERVVLALTHAFPEAKIYTSLYEPSQTFIDFRNKNIITSWLNNISIFRHRHRLALPLYPAVMESIKIDADVVIASSSAWAHGIRTRGKVVVYCHTPARFLYLTKQYTGKKGFSLSNAVLNILKKPLISWDNKAAHRAELYIANSSVIQQRIYDVYGIESTIVFPPINAKNQSKTMPLELPLIQKDNSSFFLVVSRLLPYKNVDKVIAAFRELPHQQLVIIGNGPLRQSLASNLPANIIIHSDVSEEELNWAYLNCKALIAPSYEDFGLTVIEAAGHGKPSIALEAGGYLDTVISEKTGLFMSSPEPTEIIRAIHDFQKQSFDTDLILSHAHSFHEQHFITQMRAQVEKVLSSVR